MTGWPALKSADPTLAWPALPGGRGVTILALAAQLESSQWLPPEAVRQRQFAQLDALLRHAFRTVPFYRGRLEGAGFAPDRPLTAEVWERIPVLTRLELQQAGEALKSDALPPSHGKTSEVSSSGSTGTPVTVLWSARASLMHAAVDLRNHIWHGHDLRGKLCVIRPPRKGTPPAALARLRDTGIATASWEGAIGATFVTGPAAAFHIQTTTDRQLDWLRRQDPDYLLTQPSNLRALIAESRASGGRPPRLRTVMSLGEVVTPDLREELRAAWGLPLHDTYSAMETGFMALQCPASECHYHGQSENVLLEVVDGAGRPSGPGEVGRILVTPLHNFAMPMLRYAIGDHAEVAEPCVCGRTLPLLRRILGRTRNMLVYPSGKRTFPMTYALGEAFAELVGARQYQIVQTTREEILVRLVVPRPVTAAEEERMAARVRERLEHDFRILFRYEAEIPRAASGKFEDFRCEVAE